MCDSGIAPAPAWSLLKIAVDAGLKQVETLLEWSKALGKSQRLNKYSRTQDGTLFGWCMQACCGSAGELARHLNKSVMPALVLGMAEHR